MMTDHERQALIEQLRAVEALAIGLHVAALDRGQQRPMTLTELGEVIVTCATAAVALEALSPSAPTNSWAQRIASFKPWTFDYESKVKRCYFCGVPDVNRGHERGGVHASNCLWQNAVDALKASATPAGCPYCGDPSTQANGVCRGCNNEADAMEAEPSAPAETAPNWQARVHAWMLACFGPAIANDAVERSDRFCEEALELLQAIGYSRERVAALIDYVYSREAGQPAQEVGGVMVTLAALCTTAGIDVDAARETELARVWTKVDLIRAKQKAKPTGSALPCAAPSETQEGRADEAYLAVMRCVGYVRAFIVPAHETFYEPAKRILNACASLMEKSADRLSRGTNAQPSPAPHEAQESERPLTDEEAALVDKAWEQFKAADDAAKGAPRDIIRMALDPFTDHSEPER